MIPFSKKKFHNLIVQYDAVVGYDYWQCVICFKECDYKSEFTFECIPKYPKEEKEMKLTKDDLENYKVSVLQSMDFIWKPETNVVLIHAEDSDKADKMIEQILKNQEFHNKLKPIITFTDNIDWAVGLITKWKVAYQRLNKRIEYYSTEPALGDEGYRILQELQKINEGKE